MNIEALKNQLPEYAKDIRLNLASLLNGQDVDGLSAKLIAGTALASAYATQQEDTIKVMQNYAKDFLSDADIQGVKIATTIMAMNNIYYRFTYMTTDSAFKTMPAKLRMNSMANPGIDKVDFELYALAVSAINGCQMCVDSHVKALQQHNVNHDSIQTSMRVAAVVHAVAQVMVLNVD
jgi:lipoyl-dependent peroxiredoxin subunit D